MARLKKEKSKVDKRSLDPAERAHLDAHKAHVNDLASKGNIAKLAKIHSDLQKGRPDGVKHALHFSLRVTTASALKRAQVAKEKLDAEKLKAKGLKSLPSATTRPKPAADPKPEDPKNIINRIYNNAYSHKKTTLDYLKQSGRGPFGDTDKLARKHAEREVRLHIKQQKLAQRAADKLAGKKTGLFSAIKRKLGLGEELKQSIHETLER